MVRDDEYVVLAYRRRPRPLLYIRAYPRSATDPSPAQARVRELFGEAARKARGARWRGLLPMPLAAEFVRRELKGVRVSEGRIPKWVETLTNMLPPERREEVKKILLTLRSPSGTAGGRTPEAS